MKNIIAIFTTTIIAIGFYSYAAAEVEAGQAAEGLITECSQKADAQQPQDRDAFINECMNEKLGYEKEE